MLIANGDVILPCIRLNCITKSVKLLTLMKPQKALEPLHFLEWLESDGFNENFIKFLNFKRLRAVHHRHNNYWILKATFTEHFVEFQFEEVNDALILVTFIISAEKFKIIEAQDDWLAACGTMKGVEKFLLGL